MPRTLRVLIGPILVAGVTAGLVVLATTALARPLDLRDKDSDKGPQGKDFEKAKVKDFEKGKGKEFEKGKGKDFEKEGDRPKPDKRAEGKQPEQPEADKRPEPDAVLRSARETLRLLEAEMARLKRFEADLEARLREWTRWFPGGDPLGPWGGFGGWGPGGFGPPFGPPGGRGFGPGDLGMARELAGRRIVEGLTRAAATLDPDQIKLLIESLEKLRAEKLKATAPFRPKDKEPMKPEAKPDRKPEPPSPEAIFRRLDQLSRELEELRQMLKK